MRLNKSKIFILLFVILILTNFSNNSKLYAISDKCVIRIAVDNKNNFEMQKYVVEELNKANEDIASITNSYIDLVIKKSRLDEFKAKYETKILVWDDPKDRDNFEEYTTYYEMLELMEQLEADNPNIFKMYDIGDGWEKANGVTGADRDIWAIKISDNVEVEEDDEPEMLFGFTIHAREIITPEIAKELMLNIINGYNEDDPMMKYFVNERETWIVPFQNPDGHNEVMTGDSYQRKNMHPYGGGLGVDLNRNFGYEWGFNDEGSSPNPTDQTYRGESAFSEPESQAIRDLALAHQFELSVSFHSYSQLHIFPWHFEDVQCEDHSTFMALSDSMAIHSGYEFGQAGLMLYNSNGGYNDWFYGERDGKPKAFSWTTEVGTEFHPPASEINTLVYENIPGIYFLMRQANDPYLLCPELTNFITDQATAPFNFTASFQNDVQLANLTEVVFYYKLPDANEFSSIIMSNDGNNNFSADFPAVTAIGNVEYYYTTSFEDAVTTRVVNHPRYSPYNSKSFLLGPDIFSPEVGELSGSIATIAEDMILDLQIYDSNNIDFVRGIYTINGVLDSVEMVLASRNKELVEYHFSGILPALSEETYGSIYFRMKDDHENLGVSEVFNIAWLNRIIEDFETGDFTKIAWNFSGDSNWIIDENEIYEGVYSAKSGTIDDDQASVLEVELGVGEGDLTFFYKVSSESGWDELKFYIDEIEINKWSGIENWIEYSTTLTEGVHTFKWIYEKDGSVANGSDCAWLDYINFPPVTQVGIEDNKYELGITNYELKQNYPNPFNPHTRINYELRIMNYELAQIVVHNAIGQQVWSSNPLTLNPNTCIFDGSKFNSGIYYYSLIVDGKKIDTKAMLLIK